MVSKLTPASLCVCSSSAKMTDTQINRETASIATVVHQEKVVASPARSSRNNYLAKHPPINDNADFGRNEVKEVARMNQLNARNKRTRQDDVQDINCNTTERQQQQHSSQRRLATKQMSVPNRSCNGKRSPRSLDIRKEEVMAIRNRFPTKVPIIVQRFCKETALPQLDKSKYLVPQEITMSQFLTIIRNRMRISSTQTLYLLVNNRSMISLSLTLAEVYNEYAGTDGFLYVTYASQEVFGAAASLLLHAVSSVKDYVIPSPPRGTSAESGKRRSSIEKVLIMNANESHFEAILDNTYKSMCFG